MLFIYVIVTAVIGLLFAIYLKMKVSKEDTGSEKMQEISAAIREGAMAFLFVNTR